LVSWAPDSGSVVVAQDHDHDEHVQLFRIAVDRPAEMLPLTDDRPAYYVRGGDLHPDGRWLFYAANFDIDTGQSIEPGWIYRHDLVSGERRVMGQPMRPAYTAPRLNRPGTHLLYDRKDRHPAGNQVYLLDVEGRTERELLNFGDAVKVYADWFPDGEHIMVLSESRDGRPQEHKSLGVLHWPSGSLDWLIDDPGRGLEYAWVRPDGSLIALDVLQAQCRPALVDPASATETPFHELPGNLWPLGRAPDGWWIARYYSATQPADLVRLPPLSSDRAQPTSLSAMWSRTALERERLAPAEDVRWNSSDGLQIQGWLYRSRPNPHRAVILIHGGPTGHDEDAFDALVQYLVAQRFNVLCVNYRGSTGFGLAFRELIKQDGWGGREQEDIAAGAQALIASGLAAPGRIGVTGTSYGGYSAWCQITRYPPELIAAAAPICGMTDLVVDYQTTRPDLRPYSEEMMGGSPATVPQRYYERSPINFVHNIRGKLLIVQGAQDPNVTPENVRHVVARLDEHHVPYQLLEFADEGHGITRRTNVAHLYQRLSAFFEQALGPQRS
jgi:dienelactone hydrolase